MWVGCVNVRVCRQWEYVYILHFISYSICVEIHIYIYLYTCMYTYIYVNISCTVVFLYMFHIYIFICIIVDSMPISHWCWRPSSNQYIHEFMKYTPISIYVYICLDYTHGIDVYSMYISRHYRYAVGYRRPANCWRLIHVHNAKSII